MPSKVAVDKGCKGHGLKHHPETTVYITGQKRGVTAAIKRWLKRRAVVETIIRHANNDGRRGRYYLAGRTGDRINATLAAAGYNLRQILRFLRILRRFIHIALMRMQAMMTNVLSCKMAF